MPGLCFSKPASLLLIHERPDGWLQSQAWPIKYSGSRPRLWSRITSCSLFQTVGWLLRGWSPWDLAPMSSRASGLICILRISKSLPRNPSLSLKLSGMCTIQPKRTEEPNWYIGRHLFKNTKYSRVATQHCPEVPCDALRPIGSKPPRMYKSPSVRSLPCWNTFGCQINPFIIFHTLPSKDDLLLHLFSLVFHSLYCQQKCNIMILFQSIFIFKIRCHLLKNFLYF